MKKSKYVSLLTVAALVIPLGVYADTVTQTVNSAGSTTEWNDAIWGSPAAIPAGGNDYQTYTAGGLTGSGALTRLGVDHGTITARVRAYAAAGSGSVNGGTFDGNSITVVEGSELLLKEAGTYTANLHLNGGVLRLSPDTAVSATLAGSISIDAYSVIGVAQSGASAITVASVLTGNNAVRLAAGNGDLCAVVFDDGAGLSLNAYAGQLIIGGGNNLVTVGFNQAYDMSGAAMTMGDYSTVDILNLGAAITVGSFSFGGSSLAAGTYDASALNGLYGSGSQFTGAGTMTVIPEPATLSLIAALGGGLLFVRRRFMM